MRKTRTGIVARFRKHLILSTAFTTSLMASGLGPDTETESEEEEEEEEEEEAAWTAGSGTTGTQEGICSNIIFYLPDNDSST